MAAKLLVPGYGGAYTSEVFSSTNTGIGVDTLDCSQCNGLGVQIESSGSPGGDVQLEQTFDGANWASLGSAVSAADGTISRFDRTDGPFGLVRLNPAVTAGTAEEVVVTIVGFRD